MIKGLCIDLDGTLVDSHEYLYGAFQKFMNKRSVPDTRETFNSLIGPSLKEMLENVRKEHQWKEPTDELLEEYRGYLRDLKAVDIPLFPGALEALKQFVKWDLKLALVTSAHRKYADHVLSLHKIAPFFDFVITPEDSGFISKPNGVIYQKAIQKLELPLKDVIAIEDSFSGIKSAMNANLSVFYLTHGKFIPKNVLAEKVVMLKGWPDLIKVLKEAHA